MSAVLKGAHRDIANLQLRREFIVAFAEGPESNVFTPAWNKYRAPVAEVINDEFEAESASLHELLRLVRNAAAGVDVQLHARAWIDAEAKRFADLHEAFRAIEIEEGR